MTHSHDNGNDEPAGVSVRRDDKQGKLVSLESFRPVPGAGGSTRDELVAYALREMEPFLELAREGKIRSIVIAAELVDDRSSITYPMGQWEPGLIAAVELLKSRLLDQG